MVFLMLSHSLTNFEIQQYCKNEKRYNDGFSINYLPEIIKDIFFGYNIKVKNY